MVEHAHVDQRKAVLQTNEAQKPTEETLQLKDGSATLDAKSLDDLATQLRERYPDEAYECMCAGSAIVKRKSVGQMP